MSFSYSPKIVTDGLVLCLDAANTKSYTSGSTVWNDISKSGLSGTLTNGPTFNSDNCGNIIFDGTNDYISSVSLANPNGQMTCEIGLNYKARNAYHNIFDRAGATPMLWIDHTNKIEISLSTTAGGLTSPNSYSGQILIMTTTYNSISSPGRQLFINGSFVASASASHPIWPNPYTLTLFNRNAAQTFDGKIYFLRFYNRILSNAEITQNYNATKGRFGIL